jgi:hypothetical protein
MLTRFFHNFIKDDFLREYMIKTLNVDKTHPYSRFSTGTSNTLNFDTIKKQADTFYYNNYFVNDFTFVMVTNLGTNGNKEELRLKKDAVIQRLKEALSSSVSEIRKYNPNVTPAVSNLPFRSLPKLMAVTAHTYDSLLLKFQVETDQSQEAQYESLLYIKLAINKLLRKKLRDLQMMCFFEIKIFYHSTFSIFNIELHLSHQGKSRVDRIISIVLAAFQYLRNDANMAERYEQFKTEVKASYATKGVFSAADVVETICSKLPRFGPLHAFRATETLNEFSESRIKKLLGQMLTSSNWLFVLSGDFAKQRNSFETKTEYRRLDLEAALSTKVTNNYDFATKRKEPGTIILDQIHPEYSVYYHEQDINNQEVNFLFEKSKSTHFDGYGDNPYKMDPDAIEAAVKEHDRLVKNNLIHDSFSPDKNIIGNSKCIVYRKNRLFPIPTVYANLKFGISSHTPGGEKIKNIHFSQKLLIITSIWRHRLRLIQNYLREFNGEVDVFYAHGIINLHIHAPKQHIEGVVSDILRAINLAIIVPLDIEDAKEKLLNLFSSNERTFERMNQQVINFVIRNEFLDVELFNDFKKNFYQVSNFNVNLNLVFGYFEGDLDRPMAENFERMLSTQYSM